MGREIRRVPANWEHPRTDRYGDNRYQPMHARDYDKEAREWIADCLAWSKGEHKSQQDPEIAAHKYEFFWEWDNGPPDPEYYVPYKPDKLGEAAWWQLYETVSEGTPVSPPFATKQELIDHLATVGDFWSKKPWPRAAAEQMVNDAWAPTMAIVDGKIYKPETGMPLSGKSHG